MEMSLLRSLGSVNAEFHLKIEESFRQGMQLTNAAFRNQALPIRDIQADRKTDHHDAAAVTGTQYLRINLRTRYQALPERAVTVRDSRNATRSSANCSTVP